jgi:hypothetical protein
LQPDDSSRADHRGCLDTRDIAAENVVVEHITGTVFCASFVDALKLSATDGTIVELDTENVHVSGTASAYRCWTRDALESPR